MFQILLKASNAESDLRDIIWDILTFVKGNQISADEWQHMNKLGQRIQNLNDMMIEILETNLQGNVGEQNTTTGTDDELLVIRAKRPFEMIDGETSTSKTDQMTSSPVDIDYSSKLSQNSDDSDNDILEYSNDSDIMTSGKKIKFNYDTDSELMDSLDENNSSEAHPVPSTSSGDQKIVSANLLDYNMAETATTIKTETYSHMLHNNIVVEQQESAFKDNIFTVSISNEIDDMNGIDFLESAFVNFKDMFRTTCTKNHRMFIVYTTLVTRYARYVENGEEQKMIKMRVPPRILNKLLCLEEWFDANIVQPLVSEMCNFQDYTSGWTLRNTVKLVVHCSSFFPLEGSGDSVKLPAWIATKRAIVNVQSPSDKKCFQWAILASLIKRDHPYRLSNYVSYEDMLNFSGIAFPVAMTDYKKFELQNDVSINVFTLVEQHGNEELPYITVPIYMTIKKKPRHANLLLIHDLMEKENFQNLNKAESSTKHRFHYCTITNLSRLFHRQLTKSRKGILICDSCLRHMGPDTFQAHKLHCEPHGVGIITMPPKEENDVPFTCNQNMKPFVIYMNVASCSDKSGLTNNETIISIGYFFHSNVKAIQTFYKFERSATCLEWFCNELKCIADRVYCELEKAPANTRTTEEFFTTQCFSCGHEFKSSESKHLLYCHFTGNLLGLVHTRCKHVYNKMSREILVVYHGLSQSTVKKMILVINANISGPFRVYTSNDRLTFTKEVLRPTNNATRLNFRFTDSLLWLKSPLDQLVSYLPRARLDVLRSYLLGDDYASDDQIENVCMLKPEFDVTSPMLFFTIETLPDISEFLDVFLIEYDSIKLAWSNFGLESRGSFVDLCLKSSVLQLADVFENFRHMCRENFQLDVTNYIDISDLAWNSMVKFSGVKIKVLTDMDQLMFIEKGMRGGVGQCLQRHVKANHPEMGEDQYNPQLPTDYLLYLRANDLYGTIMKEYLPESNFEWYTSSDIDVMKIPDGSSDGYILEVDLHYPKNLHDSHVDYPFCPERLSDPKTKYKKLALSLSDKKNYVLHYRTLKNALKNGLVLKKIHKCLKFKQSQWLKPFIELNYGYKTDNKYEQFIGQLLVRSVFEKIFENPRLRSDVTLRSIWPLRNGVKNQILSPYVESCIIFDEKNVAVEIRKHYTIANTPVIVGMTIMELTKCFLYTFHYDFVKNHGSDAIQLLYVDTDTFIYRIREQKVFKTLQANLSSFKTDKTLERFNNVYPSTSVLEYEGNKAKMYSISVESLDEKINIHDVTDCRNDLTCIKRIDVPIE